MISFLADENLNNAIVRGVKRRLPEIELLRVQDVGLSSEDDPRVLEWAAAEGHIVLTHDVNTMPNHAADRLRRGERISGLLAIPLSLPTRRAIDDLVLIAEASEAEEWQGQIAFLPL